MKPAQQPRWTVGAAILALAGLLILTVSGLCTGTLGIGMIFSIVTEASHVNGMAIFALLSALTTIALFGGIPMLVGFLMLRSALRMKNGRREK